jgi:glycosyltransferase involved in cell wall biosynthesis
VTVLVAIDARDATGPQLRGWGRYAQCLLRALPGQGVAFEAITNGWRGPEVAFEQLGLPMRLWRQRPGVMHSTNCFLPLMRPCPGVVTIHDLAFETWPADFAPRTRVKYRYFARRAAHSAERVICPSQFTADDVCARYGVAAEKVVVIPEAPALPVGDEPAPGGPYVLAVGDLRQKKNLAALVDAFVSLRPEHRLVLAGLDSGEGPHLRALARDARVELTGYVSDGELDALIRGADLLVHPSLYEGFGLVVLEAMVRGTPVLAARATALPQTGGDAAAYFDPQEPGSLRHELEALMRDAERRDQLARRGCEWAANFSWERVAGATAAVYRELL